MSTKLCSVESRLRYHGLGATLLPGVGEPSRLSVTPKGEPRMPPRRVAFSDSRIEQAAWEGNRPSLLPSTALSTNFTEFAF